MSDSVKTAQLSVKGNLVSIVIKEQKTNETSGEVVPEHIRLEFLMITSKGMEFIKVKDIQSKYKGLKIGEEVEVPIRVTASNMGTTFYEVAY